MINKHDIAFSSRGRIGLVNLDGSGDHPVWLMNQ